MAPLVGLPLMFLGFVVFIGVSVGLAQLLPRIRCRKWTRRIITFLLFALAMPAFVWCLSVGSRGLTILLAYGTEQYAEGLWIVDKHGTLNDGRRLSDFWLGVWVPLGLFMAMLTMLPVVVFRLMVTDPDGEPPRADA